MSSVRWPAGGAGWQSQQLSHTERKDMVGRGGSKSYSWWWDSHNAPKNSKWLEDNLNDMDAKVKAMLKLIEEDADSFAKRAEMYYKKRPELVNLVEEFYRAYRSLAERYDQLTGHVRQIPQEIQAQYGFLGDASPGSPGSGGSVRRRAAGFAAFGSSGTFKRSKAKGRKDGSASSSSSSSDSDANSKHAKAQLSDEMLRLQLDNEQLRKDLEGGVAHHQVLESRVAEIQGELKSLQQENVQLHRNAASAHSEIAALEAEIERLKRENRTLGEEHTLALRTAERLQHELEIAQWEQQRISVRLEEAYLTIQDLEARLKDLETRISLLSEELVSSATLCERQNQELGGLRDERSLLVQEVSAKMVQIQELEEEIARLKGLLSVTESDRDRSFEVHKTLERDLSDVHAEFSSVKVERGRLSGELLLKVQHVQSLEQQLIVVQEAMEIVMKEKEDLVVLLDTTESNLLNLQKEFQETKRKMREEISVQVNEKIGFQNQIGEVLAALEVLQSERSRGIELQALSEKRIKDLELELKLVQETCEACENEKNILVNEAENSILELRLEFDLVREKLNEDIALQVQEKQVLADQMVELSAALEESQGEQRRAAALQDVYEERILDLELQRKQNKEELESTEREKGELIGLLSKMENDWLNLQMEFSTVQKNLKIEISTLAEEKQSLQLRIEELEAVLAALHGERGKSVELQDVLEKKLVDYEQQLLQVQAALAVAEKERAAVGELLSNTELSLSALQEESKSRQIQLRGQLSLLAEENQSLTGQMEELQATLALLLSEKTRGIELHDVLEKRVLELQLELSQAKQEASTLSHELEGRVEAVSQLEDLIKSRDEAVSKLGADLELSIFETTRMREKLEDEFALIRRLEGEVEERGNQLVALREEISVKLEEGHVLKEQVDLLLEEKISLSKENSLHLVEIQKLKKELQEAAGTLSERAISIVNFEIQHKQFVEEREQKQVYHVQQYQVVTSNMERLELECAILREASHKLEIELTSKIQHAQQLELDLKVAEEAAIISLKEAEKLKVNLALETDRSSIAEEKSLLQEQVIVDFKKEKATLLARVEELEMRIQTLQEELEGFLAKIDHLRQEKESCDMEILALNDELSNVKVLSKEASSQFLETITALRKEKCQLEFNLANYIEELESFKKSQATWHTERGTILEAASQAANEREELQNTILIWRHRMEKLEMEHMTLRTTSKEIESSLLIHQTEYSRVHSEVSEKGNRIQWLEGELERLKLTCQGQLQEFEVKERSMESQILKCRVEIQDLDDVCKGLTKKLEIKNYEHEALKLNMQVTQETLDSTQLERDHLTMKCNSLQHEVLQEHEFRVAAEAGVSKHQAEITDLMAEIASLRTQLQQLVEEKQFLTEQMEELQATLAALHSDKTRGIELHDVLEKRVLELQLELSQAKQEASALSHDLAGRVEAVSKLECSIKSQDEIVSKLGADLGFSITESIRLRDELAGKLALIGRLEGEVEERGNQIAGLQQEISIKVEEGHVLGNQADLLLEEKITLSKENSLLLVKIEWLKKELQEASESLSERASSIVNLEMQCKQFVEEFEQKQMYHLQQYQVVKGDMEKVELQYVIVQEAHSKLEIELASKVQHAQQLELDVKVAEKVATESMEEVAMLKVSVASETLRSKKAEERCLLLEQLILGIKEEKVRLLTRVEELEMRIKTLQEELEGFLVKIDQLRHGKEACDMEIVSLNDELSKVKMLSRQSSIQFTETISALRIEISKLEADLANRSEELQFFEKERSTWHTERGTILDTVSQAAKEKEEMENAILMWTQRTEKVEMEHMTLRTKSGEIESSLLFHQTEYNRVQSEVSEKGERIQWLERELKRLELTCEEHLQKFKIKEESMGDLCKVLTEKLQGKSNEHETLKLNMQVTQETLCATQLERDNAILKCDSLQHELFQEHEFRVVAEAGVSRRQAEISELRAEIARLQIQLKELKDENNLLSGKLEAAMELEKTYAIEIEMLLKALHGSREWSGNSDVRELSWDFETKHAAKGKTSSFVHLKKSMLNLLADRSRIMEEAHVHVEHIKALNLEMEKSGQILQSSRGDYRILQNKHESALTELQALHLRIEQLERQLGIFEEEKRKLHDQLLASVRDSDNLSSVLMREKKELYEKLVSEGEHVLQLQQELKLLKNETVGNRRYMDNLQKDIEKLNLCIQEITLAKDEQERTLRDELQFYAEEKGVLAKNLNEAHGSLLVEKADVMRLKEKNNHQDQLLLKLESDIGLLRTNLFEKEALFTSSLSLAEQKVTDLLLQLGILTQEKENVFSELHEKDLLCSDKDGRIEKYLRQMESFELKLEDMKKHSAYMSQKYDATLAELESVRLQLSSLREENGRLGLDVLARTVSVTELTDTVSSIEQQNADLRVKLKKLQEDDLSLKQYNASLQVETEGLKQNLKSHAVKIGLLEEEIFKLREVHARLQSEHDCISTEWQLNLDKHHLTLSNLEKLQEELLFQRNEKERFEAELMSQYARIQELESTIAHLEREKLAFSVEIASTVVLMTETQRRADDLQEEIILLRQELTSSNERLQEKTERIKELLSLCGTIQEERAALGMELEIKIQAFGILDSSFCALKGEHSSLVDKYEFVTKEAAAGANLILKLQDEISRLSSEKEGQIQVLMHRNADILRLQQDLSLVQDSERQLRDVLDAKVKEISQLEEELDKLKAAKLVVYEEHTQKIRRLEVELKRMEVVVIGFRDEKISLSEKNAQVVSKCSDLEATSKIIQQQLAGVQQERASFELQLSLIEALKQELHDAKEMVRLMQERVANKQHEIDQVQSINEDLKKITRKFEIEAENLRGQIVVLEKKNTLLDDELSTKASLVQVLDQSLTSLKNQKVVFEGGFALTVGNFSLVQVEIDKLLEKISKSNEQSVVSGEELRKMEDRICKLQVSNLNLRDEISGLAKKEKSYVIAVRFMRAEFFCLAERIKTMKEEKAEQTRLAELAMETERTKNGEAVSGLHRELAFLREENKRQRTIIFDRAEEKREAIRQLCATIDHMQDKNRRLEGVIVSVREKIQRRIAASAARRR